MQHVASAIHGVFRSSAWLRGRAVGCQRQLGAGSCPRRYVIAHRCLGHRHTMDALQEPRAARSARTARHIGGGRVVRSTVLCDHRIEQNGKSSSVVAEISFQRILTRSMAEAGNEHTHVREVSQAGPRMQVVQGHGPQLQELQLDRSNLPRS